jgi:hypothetical protein
MHRFDPRRARRRLLALVAALALGAPAGAQVSVPYEQLAKDYRTAHGLGASEPAEVDFQQFLDGSFVRAELGALEARYPRACLADKARMEEFRSIALAILDLQRQWLDWFGGEGEGAHAARADLVELRKWLAAAHVSSAHPEKETTDLLELYGAKDKERALATRIREAFATGKALGFVPRRPEPPQLLFAPTRAEFLGLCCFIGWADESWRESYWKPEIASWTEFFWSERQVVALQYPPLAWKGDDLSQFIPMTDREPTGLLEHVVQRSGHSLCSYLFEFRLDPAFESGLTQNLAIELYGENNARSGGSGRGVVTDAWSEFVPGGNSAGGMLPQRRADSAWRETLGADWFSKPLAQGLRIGAKECGGSFERLGFIQLTADDKVKKVCVRAPFFGAAAADKPLPSKEFLADYLEFFRAYKSAFVHWLMEQGGGKPRKASLAKLAGVLEQVATLEEDPSFEELLVKAYGLAWSDADEDKSSLERQFLAWVSKQK